MAHGKKKQAAGSTARADHAGRLFRAAFYLIITAGSTLWFPELFYDGFEVPKLFAVELIAGLTLAGWVLWIFGFRRDGVIAMLPKPALALVALFGLAILSVIWSLDRWLALERLLQIGSTAGMLFFAWFLYRGKDIRRPLLLVAGIGSLLAGWGLLLDAVVPLRDYIYPNFKEVWSGGQVIDHYRLLTSNQGNPNFLFHIVVLTLPLTLGALIQTLARCRAARREMPLAGLLLFGLIAQAACFTYAANRSGLVAAAGALALFVIILAVIRRATIARSLRSYWKQALLVLAVLLLAAGAFVRFTAAGKSAGERISAVLTGGLENWQRRFSTLGNTENIDVYSRVVFIEAGAAMVAGDPLLGKGIGQFVVYFPGYKTAKHWERFSLLPPPITMWNLIPKQSHNEYLQVLIELGIPGLALFLFFWSALAWSVLKCLRAVRDSDTFYLLLGALAGLAGLLANSLLTFPLQTITSGILAWTTAGLLLAACAGNGACGTVTVRIEPRRPLAAVLLALALIASAAGVWGAQRIVRAEHLFFSTLKHHAQDLASSLDRGRQAAHLMPERFEMQYVEGWLGMLAGDTTVVRTYLERCKQVAPWFPPPYNYLGQYYFNAGLRDKSEENLVRYGEIYPPGVEGSWHMMLARIALDDTTRDRFAEVSRHLKASDNLQASMYLADLFIERQQPDSALSELLPHRQRMRWDHNEYSRLMFLTVVAELATGDSVSAFAALDTLKFNRRRTDPGVDQFYDYALELEKSLKK